MNDESDAFERMSAAWAIRSSLGGALTRRLQGNTVQFESGGELLVLGGRGSIREAFKSAPADQWEFAPAPGEMLYFSAHRKNHKRTKALVLGALAKIKIGSGDERGQQMLNKLMSVHNKTYTALHIYSAASDPEGGLALGYPALKGIMLALVLKQIIFSKL
jgi:hypothetical protein